MKVDGVVCTEFSHTELLSMEVIGHDWLQDESGTILRGHAPCWLCCRVLRMFSRMDLIELLQVVRVAFVHAHENSALVALWHAFTRHLFDATNLEGNGPSKFDEAWLLCELINFLWTLRIEVLNTTKILEKHMEKALEIELGGRCGQYLYDVLRPVTSPPESKIATTTLDKKTEYARVGEHVLPGSSPVREED
ncbi:hypothetical protein BC936DRAFT_147090 [Jimgerdemannia flammicorona]|uniref:Uncharacterized protein n=1 Tax=Jimgerdemannia flammicorona TaxID=994334 RepID=A0A433DNJ3_9FUNG|nr:hypothetical protein BC936DRAFT_147090 [Jimgerdemannia flammicorona]